MGRKNESKNKNFYHYKVSDLDEDRNVISSKYYFTLTDVSNEYNVCRRTATYHIGKSDVIRGKMKNLLIDKVKEPVYEKIERNLN